jgi:ATP-dependent Clp protease ATP-binding subunit ClpA
MTDIEKIILTAIDLAKRFKHEYVTIEHLAAVVLDDEQVRTMCFEVSADYEGLQSALLEYLNSECLELVKDPLEEPTPKKTQMLERVFNRALTQALFQGKKSINQLDLVLSILSEDRSTSAVYAEQMGLTKNKVLTWITESMFGNINEIPDPKFNSSVTEEGYGELGYNPYAAYGGAAPTATQNKKAKSKKQEHLDILYQFCKNLNQESMELDDVIGRQKELRDLVQTVARKKKSNAVLVGPSGVGKTAIVQGLAKLIVEGEVPDIIENTVVWELDMARLVAGTKYRGDFEERMKLLVEALNNLDNIILFIDEIHSIIGAGSSSGSLDAGNILKPALSAGRLKVIGATTDEEYRKLFEKESALARRFTKIQVNEPSVDEAKEIVLNTLDSYEDYHNVSITDEASNLAVELSAQYIFNKRLPDKAFDIIDRVCAYNRIMPENERVTVITDAEIRSEFSRLTGIPEEHLGLEASAETKTKHTEIREYLESTVFGQPEAIEKVTDSITISLAGLKDPSKPVASYLFTGPTGVGKTELAKRLAKSMNMHMVRYDMAEYQERHTVSKLIGSPPGYVGYGDGKAGDGLLITQLEDHPNCVLLLDEVEKAHPDIMSVLLSLLDEGVITSSTGKQVSAKNAIIILTSNLGAKDAQVKSIGFNEETFNHKAVDAAINQFFAPEFRNRLDGVIRFNALRAENMRQIVVKFLTELENYVSARGMEILWGDALIDMLEQKGYDPKMGARPLARLINTAVKLPLAKYMLDHQDGKKLRIDWVNQQLDISEEMQIHDSIAN